MGTVIHTPTNGNNILRSTFSFERQSLVKATESLAAIIALAGGVLRGKRDSRVARNRL